MSNHELQSEWTFWFEQKNPTEDEIKKMTQNDWEQKLQKIGTFNTLEGFWSYYCHLVRPSQLPKLSSYHLFRQQTKPMWENYPEGGHWLITMKKPAEQDKTRLDRLWEQLMFALIGEEFEDPDVVGIVVQIRNKEDVLSVWLADKAPKFKIGEKLKHVLNLGAGALIEYKNNKTSLKDHSGLRNAQAYYVAEDNSKPADKKADGVTAA